MSADEDILRELRLMRKLLTSQAIRDLKQRDAIALLANAGFEPKDIAEALATTAGTVSVALVALRKGGRVKKRT